jgi:hypothetical protein
MTITRNVGTAADSIGDNTTALMTAMNTAATEDVRIVLGANARFKAAWFSQNWTTWPMVIIAADRNNPPIQTEGFFIVGSGQEGWFGNRSGPFASQVQDVTFDGIHFIPRKLTQVTPRYPGGANATNYTIQDAPGGISWRIDPTFDGFFARSGPGSVAGYGAGEAYMVFFDGLDNGAQNITIQNCFFDGGGRAMKVGGINTLKFRHNTMINWAEDFFFMGGGSNVTIEYNFWNQGRPISTQDAFYGWSYGNSPTQRPPHTDANQSFRPMTNMVFQYNVMYDSGRSHFFLHQMNNQGGTNNGSVFRNNFSSQVDATGLWIGDCNNLLVERNKITRSGGSEQVKLFLEPNNGPNVICRNNHAFQVRPTEQNVNASWTWDNNTANNNIRDMPTGWIEMRPGNDPNTGQPWTPAGQPKAGQYGATGGVPNTAPSFSTTPKLNGTATQVEAGDVVTATPANVSGNPLPTFANGMLTNRWFRNGNTLIATQTDTTYPTVNPGDINDVLTYQTRANNGIGGNASHNVDSAVSNAVTVITPVVGAGAPVFNTDPVISPSNVVAGGTITAVRGQATGTATITYTNRWFRNGVLQAATGLTYVTLSTDAGAAILHQTVANNGIGGDVNHDVFSDPSNSITVGSAGAPAGLTVGQVSFEALVQDPAFPDARRTFTIRVPSTSPAFNANAMFWDSAADATTTIRPMTQLSDVAGDNIWQARSNSPTATAHLRSPNASFTNVHLYYRELVSSPQSDQSTYTFTQTVPDEGNPDPVLTDVINLDLTRRISLAEGDAYQMVTLEEGILFTTPL